MANVYKWSSIDRLCNTAITTIGNIALARILSPDDFGLLAMVAIFWSLAFNFSNCGMCDGLIKKQSPTREDYSTVFTFNAASGVVFSVIFILLAKPVAVFFEQPALKPIMWAIGACHIFQTMCQVQETRLRKELRMKQIAIVHIGSSLCAVSLGIVLALMGFGYWGLVSCRIFLSVFLFIFYVAVSRWMPRPGFNLASFKEMFTYGINLMLAYLANQIAININSWVLGKQSSSRAGFYSQAQKMTDVPYRIIESVFNWPFFAVLSNESDREKRRLMARRMLATISMVSVSLGMLLILASSPMFKIVFGTKWDASIPLFRILVIFGIITTLKYFFQTILKSHDRTALVRNYTVAEVVIQLSLLALVWRRGLDWIVWTQVFGVALISPFYIYQYCRLQKESFLTFVRTVTSNLIVPAGASVVTAAGYFFWNGHIPQLFNLLAVGASFCLVSILLWERWPAEFYLALRAKVRASIPFLKSAPSFDEDNPTDMI